MAITSQPISVDIVSLDTHRVRCCVTVLGWVKFFKLKNWDWVMYVCAIEHAGGILSILVQLF